MNIVELDTKTLGQLRDVAKEMNISGFSRLKKSELIMRLLRANAESQGFIFGGGVLEVMPDGIGFLRAPASCQDRKTSMSPSHRCAALACALATW